MVCRLNVIGGLEVWEVTVRTEMFLFWWLMEADGSSVHRRKWATRSKWDSLKLNAGVWLADHTTHRCHVTLWTESDKKVEWMWSTRTVEMCLCVLSESFQSEFLLPEHLRLVLSHFVSDLEFCGYRIFKDNFWLRHFCLSIFEKVV